MPQELHAKQPFRFSRWHPSSESLKLVVNYAELSWSKANLVVPTVCATERVSRIR